MIAHIPLEVGRSGIEPLDPAEVALQFEDAGGGFGGLESGDDGLEILLGGGIATEGILDFDESETQVEARRVGFEPIGEKAGVGLEIGRAFEPLEGPRLDEAGLREPGQGGRQHRDRLVATLHRDKGFRVIEHGGFAFGICLQGLFQGRDVGGSLFRRRDRLEPQTENLAPTPVSGSQLREKTVEQFRRLGFFAGLIEGDREEEVDLDFRLRGGFRGAGTGQGDQAGLPELIALHEPGEGEQFLQGKICRCQQFLEMGRREGAGGLALGETEQLVEPLIAAGRIRLEIDRT